jgi:hypothetical protein
MAAILPPPQGASPGRTSIQGVEQAQRPKSSLVVDAAAVPARPQVPVRQFTLRPPGLAPLDALVATPEDARGVLVYFPGFNTPLGPWEMAKCAHLADATGLAVVLTEIPGMSRFGRPVPKAIRKDMLAGRIDTWTELNLTYTAEALEGVGNPECMEVLGFSTGCSLAVSALPVLATWGPIEGLNLVEPVAITRRTLPALQAHNIADFGRLPKALATNSGHVWVMTARRSQRREPSVRYSPIDLLAIAQVLSTEGLMQQLEAVDLARCALVRGALSSLCRLPDFENLDRMLAGRGVAGPTITVEGLGHQLWHSFPMVVQLTRAMLAA